MSDCLTHPSKLPSSSDREQTSTTNGVTAPWNKQAKEMLGKYNPINYIQSARHRRLSSLAARTRVYPKQMESAHSARYSSAHIFAFRTRSRHSRNTDSIGHSPDENHWDLKHGNRQRRFFHRMIRALVTALFLFTLEGKPGWTLMILRGKSGLCDISSTI